MDEARTVITREVTAEIAARASRLIGSDISADARAVACQCLLDWIGVSLAARREPLVNMLAAVAEEEGGRATCTLLGRASRGTTTQAVLINGAMGHALDYDDVILSMGHPTVPVAPVVLALGEHLDRSGADLVTAFVVGVEAEVRVARFMGGTHYARGFHGTATFGCFGAAAAAGWLIGLDASKMALAMGIAGTQAAGLKAQFGTMCKPLHAGKAAANGLLAARLAAQGFTSNAAILETEQGFGATQSDRVDPTAAMADPPGGFWIRQTLFKYHAACYLTHSTLNAADAIRCKPDFALAEVERIEIGVEPTHLKVCAIPAPRTGLECKFSLAMTTAMVLVGEDTADEHLFSDAAAARPDLISLRDRVTITPRRRDSPTLSDVVVHLRDGRALFAEHDVGVPAEDLDEQWRMLERKFRGLTTSMLGPRIDEVIASVRDLDRLASVRPLIEMLA